MVLLITHIAIFLAFASFLGLLLGWLLWGYVARERSQEVESLREQLTDMLMASSRRALETERALSLGEVPPVLIEGALPGAQTVPLPSFLEEREEAIQPLARAVPVAPDLQAEVKKSRLQYLEQQLQELQGVRDRLPLLQADLSNAIAGKNSAESKYQELKNDFEMRTRSSASRIQDFENSAKEWEGQRAELERSEIAREKELASVRAQLRDLQNSQRPQTAEPLAAVPNTAASELAELREQHQNLLAERDALARELETSRQSDGGKATDAAELKQRIAELEESDKAKDASLQEQVSRIETLLWRVAELQPFADAAPQMEEDLKRQESEIVGHVAMHSEHAEQIAGFEKRIAELESSLQKAAGTEKALHEREAEHAGKMQTLAAEHARKVAELEQSLSVKQAAADDLEKALAEREKENRGLLAAHSDMHREMKGWKDYSAQLQPLVSKLPSLESLLSEREAEVAKLKDAHKAKDGELKLLRARMGVLADQLEAYQQHLAEIEPLAAKVPEMEQQLSRREEESRIQTEALAAKHREELTRLKVNSGQRLRRLRQGMTSFKS